MNELNLQNPEFRQMVLDIYRVDNRIMINLSVRQIIGCLGPLPVLATFGPTVSPLQRWELFLHSSYPLGPDKEARYFSGLTKFDEIKSKLL
jgi:hypothetical protein